ncbi:hypothetical protein V8E36_006585 [Tilletia maclaganii]
MRSDQGPQQGWKMFGQATTHVPSYTFTASNSGFSHLLTDNPYRPSQTPVQTHAEAALSTTPFTTPNYRTQPTLDPNAGHNTWPAPLPFVIPTTSNSMDPPHRILQSHAPPTLPAISLSSNERTAVASSNQGPSQQDRRSTGSTGNDSSSSLHQSKSDANNGPKKSTTKASAASKKRNTKACDGCRRQKCKCEPDPHSKTACAQCTLLGQRCTYNDQSKKRGPPKGYIEAIETRLHHMESILHELMCSQEPDARSTLERLVGEKVMNDIWSGKIVLRKQHDPERRGSSRAGTGGKWKHSWWAAPLDPHAKLGSSAMPENQKAAGTERTGEGAQVAQQDGQSSTLTPLSSPALSLVAEHAQSARLSPADARTSVSAVAQNQQVSSVLSSATPAWSERRDSQATYSLSPETTMQSLYGQGQEPSYSHSTAQHSSSAVANAGTAAFETSMGNGNTTTWPTSLAQPSNPILDGSMLANFPNLPNPAALMTRPHTVAGISTTAHQQQQTQHQQQNANATEVLAESASHRMSTDAGMVYGWSLNNAGSQMASDSLFTSTNGLSGQTQNRGSDAAANAWMQSFRLGASGGSCLLPNLKRKRDNLADAALSAMDSGSGGSNDTTAAAYNWASPTPVPKMARSLIGDSLGGKLQKFFEQPQPQGQGLVQTQGQSKVNGGMRTSSNNNNNGVGGAGDESYANASGAGAGLAGWNGAATGMYRTFPTTSTNGGGGASNRQDGRFPGDGDNSNTSFGAGLSSGTNHGQGGQQGYQQQEQDQHAGPNAPASGPASPSSGSSTSSLSSASTSPPSGPASP